MKTEQIMYLDYRKEENKILIQKVLRQIKPLSKYSDDYEVPLEVLEKTVSVLTRKYSIQPQWITCTFTGCADGINAMYSCGVKTGDTHEWLGTIIAHVMYELFAKLTIFMFAQVRQNKIRLRNISAEEIERKRLVALVEQDGDDDED